MDNQSSIVDDVFGAVFFCVSLRGKHVGFLILHASVYVTCVCKSQTLQRFLPFQLYLFVLNL